MLQQHMPTFVSQLLLELQRLFDAHPINIRRPQLPEDIKEYPPRTMCVYIVALQHQSGSRRQQPA